MRREVLSDELLTLPDLVRQNGEDIRALREVVAQNTADIQALKEVVAQKSADIRELKVVVAQNSADIADLTREVRALVQAVARLTAGLDISRAARTNGAGERTSRAASASLSRAPQPEPRSTCSRRSFSPRANHQTQNFAAAA